MTLVSWTDPALGSDLSVAAPVVDTALSTIKAKINDGTVGALIPTAATGTVTGASGNFYLAQPSTILNLPAASAFGRVGVAAVASVTGAAPVTVNATGGATITGAGVNAVSSVLLGTPGGSLTLMCLDGTNWTVVAGQPDSGWVVLPATAGFTQFSASYRVRGDVVQFEGSLLATAGHAGSTTLCTLPVLARPAIQRTFAWSALLSGTPTSTPALVNTSGNVGMMAGILNGDTIYLDGASYPL